MLPTVILDPPNTPNSHFWATCATSMLTIRRPSPRESDGCCLSRRTPPNCPLNKISRMAMENDRITWLAGSGLSRLRQIGSGPFIQNLSPAAVIIIRIILMIEDVKDTKTSFRSLGQSVVTVFNAAYELYSRSDDPEGFLMETLEELVETLRSILRFIEGYIQKGRFFRILTFVPKRRKFKRFRRMLTDIVGRLNFVSFQLPLPDRNAPTDHVTPPQSTSITIQITIPAMVREPTRLNRDVVGFNS